MGIIIFDEMKLQIMFDKKTEGLFLPNSQFLMKRTQQKTQGHTICRQIDITTYQIRKIKADMSLCLFGDEL